MKLYIANPTHQQTVVNYRLIEGKGRGFQTQTIAPGRQVQIAGDLNVLQVDNVVEQLTIFGLHSVKDLNGVRTYVPLVYSVDEPISVDVIKRLLAHNGDALKEIGSRLRRDAAIATSHGMRGFSPAAADTVAVSVEEEKTGTMDHGGDAPLAEGFRMNTEARA